MIKFVEMKLFNIDIKYSGILIKYFLRNLNYLVVN